MIYEPSTVIFRKAEKKKILKLCLFFIRRLKILFVLLKNNICLCNFESDTVKSDCPVQIFRKNDKIFKDLIQTVGLPY